MGVVIHGRAGTTEYQALARLRCRCHNKKDKDWQDYGGRGIKVCKRWDDFANFYADMGPRPPNHTIDRLNNNGDYKPSNCKWVTRSHQSRNRRVNRYITFAGRTMVLQDWAKELKMYRSSLSLRLKLWSLKDALTMPKTKGRK